MSKLISSIIIIVGGIFYLNKPTFIDLVFITAMVLIVLLAKELFVHYFSNKKRSN